MIVVITDHREIPPERTPTLRQLRHRLRPRPHQSAKVGQVYPRRITRIRAQQPVQHHVPRPIRPQQGDPPVPQRIKKSAQLLRGDLQTVPEHLQLLKTVPLQPRNHDRQTHRQPAGAHKRPNLFAPVMRKPRQDDRLAPVLLQNFHLRETVARIVPHPSRTQLHALPRRFVRDPLHHP